MQVAKWLTDFPEPGDKQISRQKAILVQQLLKIDTSDIFTHQVLATLIQIEMVANCRELWVIKINKPVCL